MIPWDETKMKIEAPVKNPIRGHVINRSNQKMDINVKCIFIHVSREKKIKTALPVHLSRNVYSIIGFTGMLGRWILEAKINKKSIPK